MKRTILRSSLILLGALSAGACAPTLVAQASGDRQALAPAGFFRFAEDSTDPAVRQSVRAELARLGLKEQSAAPLLVTVTGSERPRTLGVLPLGCDPSPPLLRERQDREPLQSGRIVSLGITVSEAASGRIRYQAVAAKRDGTGTIASLSPRLVRAALNAPPAAVAAPADCPL